LGRRPRPRARDKAVFATAERRKPYAFWVAVTARVEHSRRDGALTPVSALWARRPVRDGEVHGLAEMPCERSCYAAGGCGRRQPSVTRDMSRSVVSGSLGSWSAAQATALA